MNPFVILYFVFYAIYFFVVTAPVLFIILWIINKWILKKKIKLVFWFLIPLGTPLVLIGLAFAYLYYIPYSTSNIDAILEQDEIGIKLPKYKIVDYESRYVGGDDLKDTYQIEFKHNIDKSLLLSLDSLCLNNSQWEKTENEYRFSTIYWENEIIDSLIIKPKENKAIYIRYKW